MKEKFWDYGRYFASGYVIHIVLTEKMTALNAICLASFIIMIASDIYYYRKSKDKAVQI
jgi:hypothetical protein